ncbi:MAG: hypothetical protein HC845_05975 [Akkermansiaceae bacterium]|nr:hypothetical protein [Akkermansiaceae bacterium]
MGLNAANEVAVDQFRAEKIDFPGIWQCVATVMDAHPVVLADTPDLVVAADRCARETASALCIREIAVNFPE